MTIIDNYPPKVPVLNSKGKWFKIFGVVFVIFLSAGAIFFSHWLKKATQYVPKAEESIDRCSLDIEVVEDTPTPPPPTDCSCIPAYYCTYGILRDCGNGDACCVPEPTAQPLPTR